MEEKYFEVGQTVYCAIYGEMKVVKIETCADFQIICKQKNGTRENSYTFDGRHREDSEIVLSQTPIQPIVNKPLFKPSPAYFYHDGSNMWFYDTLLQIDVNGCGKAKENDYWYDRWQYEAPIL